MKAQTKKLLLALAALAALAAVMIGCWLAFGPKAGEAGAKTITVQVVADGEVKSEHSIGTDAEYLRGALEEAGLVAGEDSEYGLFITQVDGIAADEARQEWWCITKGGKDVMTGVDSTPIADGDTFELTLMVGY